MLPPLQWFLRLGGMLPNNTKNDIYFTFAVITLHLLGYFENVSSIWKFAFRGIPMTLYTTEVSGLMVTTMFILLKVQVSKTKLISLANSIFNSEGSDGCDLNLARRFETFSVLVVGMFFVARVLSKYKDAHQLIRVFMFECSMALMYAPIILQIVMTYYLVFRFTDLNDQLMGVSEAVRLSSSPISNLRSDLISVFRSYNQLRDLTTSLSTFFGTYNVFVIGCQVMYVTQSMYSMLLVLIDVEENLNSTQILVLVTVIASIIIHCEICYRCSKQAMETIRIAHYIVDSNTPPEIVDVIEVFSLTMFNNPLEFTAARVFKLNRGLITKVTLAATACLIISMQVTNLKAKGDPSRLYNSTTTAASTFTNY